MVNEIMSHMRQGLVRIRLASLLRGDSTDGGSYLFLADRPIRLGLRKFLSELGGIVLQIAPLESSSHPY
jgi:hypothetical protein